MFSARRAAIVATVFTSIWAIPASADEVVLTNGDRITGTLVELADGKLVIETEYAGVIKIDWSKVQTLSTDGPVYVTIGDNTVRATVSESDSGAAMLESEDLLTVESIELSRLESMSYERKPAVKLSGYINIGASSASGNTNTDRFNANAELVARSKQNRFTVGGLAYQAKDDGEDTASAWLAYLKYDHFISDRWYAFANASGENDKFKDIKLRTTFGLGGGYQAIETQKTFLSLELGVNYVNTDFYFSEDQDYPASRWYLDFWRKLFDTESKFFQRTALFSSLNDSQNLFIRSQTGLRLPVAERINSTIQFDYEWDKNPAPGRGSEDRLWLFTLGYSW